MVFSSPLFSSFSRVLGIWLSVFTSRRPYLSPKFKSHLSKSLLTPHAWHTYQTALLDSQISLTSPNLPFFQTCLFLLMVPSKFPFKLHSCEKQTVFSTPSAKASAQALVTFFLERWRRCTCTFVFVGFFVGWPSSLAVGTVSGKFSINQCQVPY